MITGLDIYSKKLICSECGSTIDGRYNRYDRSDKILCEKCSKNSSQCDICSVPSALLDKHMNLKVCPACLSKKDICSCCGKKIKSPNVRLIKGVSGFFCPSCISKSKGHRCDVCKSPAKNENDLIETSSNKKVCGSCFSNHIFSIEIAKNILSNLAMIIEKKFGLESKNIPQIYLSTAIELKFLRKMKSSNIINNYENTSLSAFENKTPSIYMLSGMPLEKFIGGLVSEYLMCWFKSNHYFRANYEKNSSFSKWVTIKILNMLGYQKERKELVMKEALNNRKSGLTKLILIERESGIDGVIDFATSGRKRKRAM